MTALARALSWFIEAPAPSRPTADPPLAPVAAAGAAADSGRSWEITSAAVLGRPGEAEPVAAALALALSRAAQTHAATVVVLGAQTADPAPSPQGGARATRRLASRLEAHGLTVRSRGRLVWVPLPPASMLATARRAALVGAPAVVAVTAPRTVEIDELLGEQDLIVVVTRDPDGPLARLAAAAHRTSPFVAVRPLPRGAARALARGGVRPPRSIRGLIATAGLEATT